MKGCTDYTDEATRWTRPSGGKPLLFRLLLILVLGAAVLLGVAILWPKVSEEGFAVASAEDRSIADESSAAANVQLPTPTEGQSVPGAEEEQDATREGAELALVVYLTGAVVSPGVYELEQGARINDAIVCAGGLDETAATSYINLAALLEDAQHVHIPSRVEIESGEAERIAAGGAIGSSGAGSATVGSSQGEQKVNINTADSAALESLPGIGVATAQRIIDYREKNGPFASIEGLKEVSGIGEKKYAELADKVCV